MQEHSQRREQPDGASAAQLGAAGALFSDN
jgi:hypothetical protein